MIDRNADGVRKVASNRSWFRDTPHYWAEASLPLAYAVACVEVVCKSSEKARIIYNRVIEAWSDAGIRAILDKITCIKPAVIQTDSYALTTGRTTSELSNPLGLEERSKRSAISAPMSNRP